MGFSALRLGLGISAVVAFAYVVACGSDDSGDGAATVPEGGLFPTPEASASSSSGTSGTPGAKCGADGVTGGFAGSQTIMVNGTARTYELFVPTSYDGMTTYPLAFVFHGDGGTGAGIRSSFGIEATSGGGAIFVYPDGLDQTWDIDDSTGLLADAAFIDAVAADLAKTHCADTQHLFAVGFSKGAYFVNQLACVSTSNFRGVVSFEGGGPFYVDGIPGMKFDDSGNLVCPAPPLAALQVQGTADTTVPPSEGQKARDHWIAANTCQSTTSAYDPSPCVSYDGCDPARPEVWCLIPGLTHSIWSMGTQVTWDFMKSK